ncbi:MAG: hypothetical protein ACKVVP_05240, partial [Chloroflexota bacterium]
MIRDRYEKTPGTMVRTLMLAIVVAALGLRLAGIPWQLPWHFHPDESDVVDGAAHAVIRGNLGAMLSPIRPFEALIVGELALLHPLIP